MPIVYEKLLALKIPDVEHSYGPKDCMLYALGARARPRSRGRGPACVRLREEPQGAADDGGRDRPSRLLGEGPRHRHRLGPRGRGRIFGDAAPAADARRHRDQQDPRHRDHRQGRGQGRGALFRAHHRRQGDRRAHRDAASHDVLPRRRRLRRPAAPAAAGASDPGARARCRLRPADPAGDGADLSALRRPATRCMPTPRWRRPPASRARSCTGWRPMASPATRFSRASAATIRRS